MDKLKTALRDVEGLAKVAAKLPQGRSRGSSVTESNCDSLIYKIPNSTLSHNNNVLHLESRNSIDSMPKLISQSFEENGKDGHIEVPKLGDALDERNVRDVAEFLNKAVLWIRDGIKGMLANTLENGLSEERDLVKKTVEENNQKILELKELHRRIISEREDLLTKVTKSETEVVEKVVECGNLLKEMEELERELRTKTQKLQRTIHQKNLLQVEVEKLKNITEILQRNLKESRENEQKTATEIIQVRASLTNREVEVVDLESKLVQLQEKLEYFEENGTEKDKPTTNKKTQTQTYFVQMQKTSELLENISKLREKASQGDESMATMESLVRDLVREHETCKDTLFLLRRDMLGDVPRDILSLATERKTS